MQEYTPAKIKVAEQAANDLDDISGLSADIMVVDEFEEINTANPEALMKGDTSTPPQLPQLEGQADPFSQLAFLKAGYKKFSSQFGTIERSRMKKRIKKLERLIKKLNRVRVANRLPAKV